MRSENDTTNSIDIEQRMTNEIRYHKNTYANDLYDNTIEEIRETMNFIALKLFQRLRVHVFSFSKLRVNLKYMTSQSLQI